MNAKIIEAATLIDLISELSYEEADKAIAEMTAEELGNTTGDIRTERIKLIEAYAEQLEVSEIDSIQFTADDTLVDFAERYSLLHIGKKSINK